MSWKLMPAEADIFDSQCEALVNPVDCTGAQGKGLAFEFAKRWPMAALAYKSGWKRGQRDTGSVYIVLETLSAPTIVFFPTKRHWRDPSKQIYIMAGLVDLAYRLVDHHIRSVAVPALGCGEGRLPWPVVRPMLISFAEVASDEGIDVELYPPRQS